MINSITTTSNITNQPDSVQVDSKQVTDEKFADYLSNKTSQIDTTKKPDIKELMDYTNISFQEASSILYGVIGSNEDKRDWNKILTNSDILKTAKEETAKMYQSDDYHVQIIKDSQENTQLEVNPTTTLVDVQEGNIKFTQTSEFDKETQKDIITNSIYIASSNGNILRNAGNTPQQIFENVDAFGFNIEPLKTLINNQQIPKDIKNLMNDTVSYYNNLKSEIKIQANEQSYSTFELLSNSLNTINNSNK